MPRRRVPAIVVPSVLSTVRPICTSRSAQIRSSVSARAVSASMSGAANAAAQRGRKVGDEADEGIEHRLARGADPVRQQKASRHFRELAGRVGGERLPRLFGIAPGEPPQRPAETRVQSCSERSCHDRAHRLHRDDALDVYVTGNFIMQGKASIAIAPGASLELYVGGARTSITTLNNAGNCANFSYFGLPANKSIDLSGNDVFLGCIYAPSADLTLSGGGNNSLDYQGAIAVNTIGMNGHFNFHFDENLKRKGPTRGYQIISWTEI